MQDLLNTFTPFNFRLPLIFGRGWPKIRGTEKVYLFLGSRKLLKGPKFFQNSSITLKQKRKNAIYLAENKRGRIGGGWPKIRGIEN